MVHSICIYVRLFIFIFLFLFMLLLVDYQNPSPLIDHNWIHLLLNGKNLELSRISLVFCFFFFYLPSRSECVGKPCEMVTWPNVCYDVILKS